MDALNIGSRSSDWRARRLSNFSDDDVVLDEVKVASVEGFIQGIKFPEGDPRRSQAFTATGFEAKRLGKGSLRSFVWWKGQQIVFGSSEHHHLIERAIRAKFDQNSVARAALIATDSLRLTHDLGHPESPHTSLPSRVFCDILTRIRQELLGAR